MGCLPRGVVCVSQHAMGLTPPVNKITDRCKNITLAQTSFAGSNNWFASVTRFFLFHAADWFSLFESLLFN